MQEMEGFYFYLFPYYRGTVLKNSEVTEEHCRKIGKILARIHGIDKKNGDGILPKMSIDWKFYLDRLKERNTLLYELLGSIINGFWKVRSVGTVPEQSCRMFLQFVIMIWIEKCFVEWDRLSNYRSGMSRIPESLSGSI